MAKFRRAKPSIRVRDTRYLGGSIEGLAELQRKIDALPDKLISGVREALWGGVSDAVAQMKAIAPVDTIGANATHLRDHIHAEPGPHELAFDVIADPLDPEGRGYAAHVEYGHRAENGKHIPAEPYFWPVIRVNKRKIKNRVSRATTKALKP